ncbi:MAG: anaerobic ribonucleoside-triphosphate reductase activating protein [Pseudobdellovibrionaceae bacterium]
MKIYKFDILFQEVPNEISLGFYVCGCPLQCVGCHSPELWSEQNGFSLDLESLSSLLDKYGKRISCVLFLGGEWHATELISFLSEAQNRGLKTAHYTGHTDLPQKIKSHLNYLKCGPWIEAHGGLSSPTTNQIFWDLKNNLRLNHLFQQPETQKETL